MVYMPFGTLSSPAFSGHEQTGLISASADDFAASLPLSTYAVSLAHIGSVPMASWGGPLQGEAHGFQHQSSSKKRHAAAKQRRHRQNMELVARWQALAALTKEAALKPVSVSLCVDLQGKPRSREGTGTDADAQSGLACCGSPRKVYAELPSYLVAKDPTSQTWSPTSDVGGVGNESLTYSRRLLLRSRSCVVESHGDDVLAGLRICDLQEIAELGLPPCSQEDFTQRSIGDSTAMPPMANKPILFGAVDVANGRADAGLRRSEGSWRPQKPQSHEAEITRCVQNLLNIAAPENLARIVERFGGIAIRGPEDLQLMVQQIIRQVLEAPHICETYADLVYSLRTRYPHFPPLEEGRPAITFERVLITAVQIEFEAIPTQLEPQRKRAIANMKFIGHLFLRQLLGEKIISIALKQLLQGCEEHMVFCACELLLVIGHALNAAESGRRLAAELCSRLTALREGADGTLTKRLHYKIQDVLDAQQREWQEYGRIGQISKAGQESDEVVQDALWPSVAANDDARQSLEVGGATSQSPVCGTSIAAVPYLDYTGVHSILAHYAEEPDIDRLVQEWCAAAVATASGNTAGEQLMQAMDSDWEVAAAKYLLQIGVECGRRSGEARDDESEEQAHPLQSVYAEAVAALVSREVLEWSALATALSPWLIHLPSVHATAGPTVVNFLARLLARLLLGGQNLTHSVVDVLLATGQQEKRELTWKLLLETLRWVKQWGSAQLAQRAASTHQLSAALRMAGGLSRRKLAETLKNEGLGATPPS